jgi:predicted lipoprotein with Yx(FWY)xxD motif
MKRTIGIATSVAAVALTAVAYGGSTGVSSAAAAAASPTPGPTSSATAPASSMLAMRNTNHGPILVDGKGRTLYLFAADKTTTSTCTGACAAAWPPALAGSGKPTVGSGLTASMVGTTKRSDGTTQVTYAGHPLYYFSGDMAPGQANGQNLTAFGAKWYVVTPKGTPVTAPSVAVTGGGSSSSASASSSSSSSTAGGPVY